MRRPGLIFGKFVFASVMALLLFPVQAQQCPINLQLTYPNGDKGCLSELPIAQRLVKNWGKPAEEIIRYAARYSLAASATCTDIYISSNNLPTGMFQPQLDSNALGSCDKKCDCVTVIQSGRVLINKEMALALGKGVSQTAMPQVEQSDKKLKQQEQEHQLALQHLQEQKQEDLERAREREKLRLEAERREQEQLAQVQRLKAQQRVDEEARLLEQIKREKALKEREEALLAQENRFREQQRLAEEARLKAEEQRLQASQREEAARQAAASPSNPDRELLMQLAAELTKLRQQQAEQDKRPTQSAALVAQEVLPPIPVMANRKALVIGNDRYKFVSPLNTAKEDAKSIADGLKAVGYQVSLKLDVSEKEFKATLRQFRNQVEAGDEVAFFYAGQGVS